MSEPVNKPLLAAALFGLPGLLIAMTEPFKNMGDSIKPGLGDLANGTIGLLLLIMAPVAALIVKKRNNPE